MTFICFWSILVIQRKKVRLLYWFYFFMYWKMKITKQIMEEFLNFYRNQNFQNDTIENYRRDFTEFMRLFIRRWYSEIEEIRHPIVEEWRTILRTTRTPKRSIYYWKNKYLSERTIQCKVQAVKKFLEFVNTIYEIWMDYRRIKVPKVYSQHHDYFEESEIEQIIATVRNTEKYTINRIRSELMVVLGFTTWMRLSELLKLKVREVLSGSISILGKGRKERFVSFQPICQDLLWEYLRLRGQPIPRVGRVGENKADDDYVFISHRLDNFGKPITPQTVCWLNKKYNINLNNLYNLHKKYTTHTLRSSFATHLLENDVNIREIQVMLGHSDLKTTEWYLRVKNKKLEETQKRVFWSFGLQKAS